MREAKNKNHTMDLCVEIVTPNGRSYKQPTGLFINNEIVPATGGQTITSLDPAYVKTGSDCCIKLTIYKAPTSPSPLFKRLVRKMLIAP
jgi:hypothetical protein